MYIVPGFIITNYLTPVRKTWRPLAKARLQAFGLWRTAQTRLALQSEAVAALKGSMTEQDAIKDRYELFQQRTTILYLAHLKFGLINNAVMGRMANCFVGAFVIAPGCWNPRYEVIDSIDKMAEVRADVGTQWVLFTRVMQAARRAVEMFRKLQELVGEVERVTDLLELLDVMQGAKQEEFEEQFVEGDHIAFEGCDIFTPASPPVKLVENLSFSLRKGGSILLTGHNGAGKSSIFRAAPTGLGAPNCLIKHRTECIALHVCAGCMGGLWKVPRGKITKPGGATMQGTHGQV
jgi:ABC-type uncharacterized transport system fused permease/ATPase subunit